MKDEIPEKPKEEKQPAEKAVPQKNELEELRKQVEALQKEKDELFAKLQRVSADYINFQKRIPKQVADTVAYEKERLLKSILPILDNFELTLQNAEVVGNIDDLVKGVKIIYDHLLDILKSHNVEQINALGEKFDPSQHEAMTHRAEPEKADGVVLEEYQKGYKLDGRVFRPSRVIVNKLPSQQQVESAEEEDETKDTE
jgi:molecular chaperone GrpE